MREREERERELKEWKSSQFSYSPGPYVDVITPIPNDTFSALAYAEDKCSDEYKYLSIPRRHPIRGLTISPLSAQPTSQWCL